jgi:hypothetical protein
VSRQSRHPPPNFRLQQQQQQQQQRYENHLTTKKEGIDLFSALGFGLFLRVSSLLFRLGAIFGLPLAM